MSGSITDVAGITVGHWTDATAKTGCTVVLCPEGTLGSCDVRGGAPGTRETDVLRPGMTVEEVHGVVLSGGSAFGLAAADGVMRWLEERGIGVQTAAAVVPIVPAAVLYDLGVGDPAVRPDSAAGYAACEVSNSDVLEGLIGAGAGATVAKHMGVERAVEGGIGTASLQDGELVVAALVAVNAVGEILGEDGEVIAGALEGKDVPFPPEVGARVNTTIGVVATNATVSRERLHLLANAAHDGMDVSIQPSHTKWDGDTLFTLATGSIGDAAQPLLEQMSREVVAAAVRSAVRAAGAA